MIPQEGSHERSNCVSRSLHLEILDRKKALSIRRIMVAIRVLMDEARLFQQRMGRRWYPKREEKQGDEILEALHVGYR